MSKRLIYEIDLDTGRIISETYWLDQNRHRDPRQGAAVTKRDAATGTITIEEYRFNGRLHRPLDRGPAFVMREAETGAVLQERYIENGKWRHGPADVKTPRPSISRWLVYKIDLDAGRIIEETYFLNFKRHRNPQEGPARLWRDADTGIVTLEEYRVKGVLHRPSIEGPALWSRDSQTGQTVRKLYFEHGHRHRDPVDGPALFERFIPSSPREEYWEHGKQVPAPQRPADNIDRRRRGSEPS